MQIIQNRPPVLPSAQNADNHDDSFPDNMDDEMLAVRMKADSWSELVPLGCQFRHRHQQIEDTCQPVNVTVSLID